VIWLASVATGMVIFLIMPAPVRMPRQLAVPQRQHRTVPIECGLVGIVCSVVIAVAPNWWWLAAAGGMVALVAGWLIKRFRAARARAATANEVTHGCSVLAAQLRIGQIPARALQAAATDVELFRPAWVCQQVGGEVGSALTQLAERPGAGGLQELARAWRICELSGAALAPAVQQVTAGQRVIIAARRTVAAELAAAKATGRLLACLPIFGIAFGFVAGGDPIKFLTSTLVGQVCLTVAVCLACAGLIWTEKLADGIEQELD